MADFALYDAGKFIGNAQAEIFQGKLVLSSLKPVMEKMAADALKEGVVLTYDNALRTQEQQIAIRKKNAIPSRLDSWLKANRGKTYTDFIMYAEVDNFSPHTGKPGHSNHQNGQAVDYNVTGYPKVYGWLVRNAFKYGMVRTVPTERWHWEFRPDWISPFAWNIPPTHYTWDGMATDLAKLAAEIAAGRIKKFVLSNPGKTGGTLAFILLTVAGLFFLNRKKKKK
jgi:hypothetical protein